MSSTIFKEIGFSENQSLLFTMIGVFSMMLFEPLAGKLADAFGAYKVLVVGIIGIMLLSLIHTWLMLLGIQLLIYLIQVIYGITLAMYMGVTPDFLSSLVVRADRCRILGLGYNIPLMIFGGTIPVIILYLTQWSYYASSIYLIFTCFLALYGLYLLLKRGKSYDS